MAYFLIALANRNNLELCLQHNLAGFTNNASGLWTFTEIQEGDFISFLYGARIFNLYRVEKKKAFKNSDKMGPWEKLTLRSKKAYTFPFRLFLTPIRKLEESIARSEFAYVAENLLLRGGYRKTHFQADQTTLQAVSQMGELWRGSCSTYDHGDQEEFLPRFVIQGRSSPPERSLLNELILQSLVRQWLSDTRNLQSLFSTCGFSRLSPQEFEVLGEKALSTGHVDVLIKDIAPCGYSRKMVVEMKRGRAQKKDVDQLHGYLEEIGEEALGGILIAREFPKNIFSHRSAS